MTREELNKPRDNLFCSFCGKSCKSLNSLNQHSIRCKDNPDRKDFDRLGKYSTALKGQTQFNNDRVRKSASSLRIKYKNGFISPVKGRHNVFEYIYKEHNEAEIQKWLAYVKESQFIIPHYDIISHTEGYSIVSMSQRVSGKSVRYEFEHNCIANILLDGKLDAINTVHHIDSNRSNNDPFNLLIFQTNSEHKRFHNSPHAYLTYNAMTHLFNCILLK